MFKSKTAFVLGAGASHEFDLPLGSGLANIIRHKMGVGYDTVGDLVGQGDRQLLLSLHQQNYSMVDLLRASRMLRDGLPLRKSVDDFLDIHRDDPTLMLVGKAAIVKAIMEAERNSKLALDPRNPSVDFQSNVDSWLAKLIKMLGPSGPASLIENAIFVSFNYDRTLEYFLYHGMRALYGYDQEKANQVVEQIKVLHPYGTVGLTRPASALKFVRGQPVSDRECIARASSIRTYTEEMATGGIKSIREALKGAKQIIFLGFGFHEQNIRLLTPDDKLPDAQVFATRRGVSGSEVSMLKARITDMFQNAPTISFWDGTCAELFDERWFTFSQM